MKILNEFINKNINLVNMMKECSYSYDDKYPNLHHLEGNIWTHTMMAYANTVKYDSSKHVKWAIILHDIGRILTREENSEKKKVSFGRFEGVSTFMSIGILNKTDLTYAQKLKILKIISYQYTVIDYIKYDKPSKFRLLNKFKYQEDILQELAQYAQCDLLGREIDKSKANLYNRQKIRTLIEYTKTLKKNIRAINNKQNTVNILVGPPCSKKSTWAKKYKKNAIIINRDSCVEEIGKNYDKHNYNDAFSFMKENKNIKKEVNTLDNKRAEYAKNSKHRDIIIDNPNLTLKNRKEWISIFKSTHLIKVTIFLSSFDELLECSEKRGKEINKNISKRGLLNKLKTFTYPLLSEGIDYIEYEV